MWPKPYLSVIAICFILLLNNDTANAQCTNRYLDTIFNSIDSVSNVPYTSTAGGGVDTQLLDIYQPTGDTAHLRPLIIWTHGGSFFQGNKNDGDIETLCNRFTRRGYVCAAINYRLAASVVSLYDSLQDFKYMIWAMSDLKAAIRFMKMQAANGNPYNIDTTMVYIGGTSAGGIASDFAATMDSFSLLPPSFQAIVDSNGGIEGNSGNPGYSTRPYAVASLAGAINNLDWIHPSSPPTVMCQGTADRIVPYDCAYAFSGYTGGFLPTIKLCGSSSMAPQFTAMNVRNAILSFPGSDHVPWDTNVVIANRMDSMVAAFFYTMNCQIAAGIKPLSNTASIAIYPNPANTYIQIRSEDDNELKTITILDYTGRQIMPRKANGKETSINIADLAPGVYVLKVAMNDEHIPPVIKLITIDR